MSWSLFSLVVVASVTGYEALLSPNYEVAPHDILIPFDFENNELKFKTNTKYGSGAQAHIQFWTNQFVGAKKIGINGKKLSDLIIDFVHPHPRVKLTTSRCFNLAQEMPANQSVFVEENTNKLNFQFLAGKSNLWNAYMKDIDGAKVFTLLLEYNGYEYSGVQVVLQANLSSQEFECENVWKGQNVVWIKFVSPQLISKKSAIKLYKPEVREYTNCRTTNVGTDTIAYWKIICIFDHVSWYKCMLSDEYYAVVHSETKDVCEHIAVDRLCENDPGNYQVCGIEGCHGFVTLRGQDLFCGTYVCEGSVKNDNEMPQFGSMVMQYIDCNGNFDCKNTILDETNCENQEDPLSGEDEVAGPINVMGDMYSCFELRMGGRDGVVTRKNIPMSDKCDVKCDCVLCDDEMFCNGVSYGLECDVRNKRGSAVVKEYIGANSFCDGIEDCYKDPNDPLPPLDERYCGQRRTIGQCMNGEETRNLFPNQICAVPTTLQNSDPICTDGRDQMNCVDESRVGLSCLVNGTEAKLSYLAVCGGYRLCDDGYDDTCLKAEGDCTVHKALLCNEREDCADGGDEKMTVCRKLHSNTCVRRYPFNGIEEQQIPADWVGDGTVDCVDGRDEDLESWDKCGLEPHLARYVDRGTVCEDVYLCGDLELGGVSFIQFFDMCDRINTCGREIEICMESRNQVKTWNTPLEYTSYYKFLLFCIRGLENLQRDMGWCHTKLPFGDFLKRPVGVARTYLDLPKKSVDCSHTFGEALVYLSCTGLCLNTECVLKPVKRDTCVNFPKALTLTQDSQLSIVVQTAGGRYEDKVFPCANKRCVAYSDVCNLVNDCGDGSDEVECKNHYFCPEYGEFIPISSKCDGFEDCRGFEDECNDDCTKNKRLISSHALRMSAWSFGASGVTFNGVLLVTSIKNFWQAEYSNAAMNHALITTIGLSDTVVGIYLLVLAYADLFYEDSYCRNRYLWLSSKSCAALGVVNNIAIQLSLFSMSALSILRVFTIGKMVQKKLSDGRFERIKIIAMVSVVIALALPCAVIPLVPSFEDFFVNGLYYHDNPIFTASVNKLTHFNILKAHYGRLAFRQLSWKNIRMLVREMFSKDYGGITGETIHFYGNDGVCVFKYLVTMEDPQKWFSLGASVVNLTCGLVIAICYILIYSRTSESAKNVASATNDDNATKKRNRILQSKITAIVVTNFLCLLPFTVAGWLHFGGVYDATKLYPLFTIVILPINSVINPLLYENTILNFVVKLCKLLAGKLRKACQWVKRKDSSRSAASFVDANDTDRP
ncbi:hypothetical protein ACHWQZ_G009551 [Mnemiopsis leidyi]